MKYDLTTPTVRRKLAAARELLASAKDAGEADWVAWYEYVIDGLEQVLAVNAGR